MVPPRDSSSEEPIDNSSSKAKLPKDYENIVDELKNVLSGLGKSEAPLVEPGPAPFQEEPLPPQTLSPSNDFEPEKLGEAAFRQASEPSSTPQPSDAEFWKGNVLGWPSSPVEPPPPPPPISIPAFKNEPPLRSEPPRIEKVPDPLPDDPWMKSIPNDLPQVFRPTPKKEPVLPQPEPEEDSSFEKEFTLPPAPTAPQDPEPSFDLSAFNTPPVFETQGDAVAPPEPPSLPDPKPNENNSQGGFLEKLRMPVPETIHQTPETSTKKISNDRILDEMNLKPSDHIQIACLFPDGHESFANDFIMKLKTAASKAANFPAVEVVLCTPWFLAQINPYSWKKAASISGAHFLFVLAYRKDKDNFKDLTKLVHKDDVKTRLVLIEQINLRTLYADLLSDVLGSFNVKG